MDDHLLLVDDRQGTLHLTLERRRPPSAGDVDPDGCAAALDAWLAARDGRPVQELTVCTTQMHHGDLGPIVEVLATRRPAIARLSLGALTFPDFARGDDTGDNADSDGSSWRLDLPDLAALLAAVPEVEELAVQVSALGVAPTARMLAPRLRRLALRIDGAPPELHTALARAELPVLETLELWPMQYCYGWGGSAGDLAPLLAHELPALRRLAIIGDLGDALIDVLADSRALPLLRHVDLSHGVIGDPGATRLRARWPCFAHLRRLELTGNQIGRKRLAQLRRLGGVVVGSRWQRRGEEPLYLAAPPPISLHDGLFARD
jgi:hypothetical protein